MLAKSSNSPDAPRAAETLGGHTAMVLAAAERLLAVRGAESLAAVGLPGSSLPTLEQIVRLAALMHDLGKASDHFQGMVRHRRDAPQLVRHDALAAWLAWPGQPLHEVVRPAVETDTQYLMAIMAAAGHHRRFPSAAVAASDSGAGFELTLLLSHLDFVRTLALGTDLGVVVPHDLADVTVSVGRRSSPVHLFEEWSLDAEKALDASDRMLLAVAKALLIAADVAGSALPRVGQGAAWVEQTLQPRAGFADLGKVVTHRLGLGVGPRPFQKAVAASSSAVTIVRAGCGTGKTVAAFLWAACRHPGRPLWITYPTTGTATEGFRDYVFDADVVGRLEHGRAEVDVDIFGLDEVGAIGRDLDRLDALRAWGCDVVTCTADTVLGLLQNHRRGLYAWPALAHAAVVFDEVHAYDDRMFGTLLRFLRGLPGVPVLLMTASLPAARLAAIQQAVRRVHGVDPAVVEGPAELEQLPRYRRCQAPDPFELVGTALAAGGKVLWVTNTVGRCMRVFDDSRRRGWSPIAYHSRFRYVDRVRQHGRAIEAFRTDGPALLVSTQVAEMSLDLSADLLVTDLAPVPALIQRLGRLNRRSTPEHQRPAAPFLILPFKGQPYSNAMVVEAKAWLDGLGDGDLSQADLAAAWKPALQAAPADSTSPWLDGVFATEPGDLREPSPGLTVVLPTDAPAVRAGTLRVVEVSLPMNPPPGRSRSWMSWPRLRLHPVPPAERVMYDAERGAEWRKA
ncbi:MAG: CRISPR-associated helicase Cas3' [Deltaproteobacteria bacterium]|nr:CRISPR-associated helicase Cas3' [Deltaproteobacteria bacterium]